MRKMNKGVKIIFSIIVILLGITLSYVSIYGMNCLGDVIGNIKISESLGGFLNFILTILIFILLVVVFIAGCALSSLSVLGASFIVLGSTFELDDDTIWIFGCIFSILIAIAITFIPDIFNCFKDGTLSAFQTSYAYDYWNHIKSIKDISTAGLFSGIWIIIKLIFWSIIYYVIQIVTPIGLCFVFN